MQPVEIQKRTTGKPVKVIDRCGGVFAAVPRKAVRPAYGYGPKDATTRDVMFQCPVSAIPQEIWQLLIAWWQCRNLGLPVRAGGADDQPGIVRYAFPFFEAEMRSVESKNGSPERAAAMAVGAMVKAMGGGRK